MFYALADKFSLYSSQFRYSIYMIETVYEIDYSLCSQIPLVSLEQIEFLNQHRYLMNANINILVVCHNAEGYYRPSFWNGGQGGLLMFSIFCGLGKCLCSLVLVLDNIESIRLYDTVVK